MTERDGLDVYTCGERNGQDRNSYMCSLSNLPSIQKMACVDYIKNNKICSYELDEGSILV